MKHPKKRRLAAIMFTDIVGYTALMQEDEAMAAQVRARHRAVFKQQHDQFNGEILQYFGDGTLSLFQSGVEAVACAVAMQQAFGESPEVPLRIGLHLGDVVFDGTEIYGDGVNLASRIESMGVPGGILLSGKLNDELKNQPQISTISLGLFEFKNVTLPIEVFAVSNMGVRVPARAELKGKGKQQSKSIAVLPFVNRSGDPENEYLCDGITEEIINALTKIEGLKVTSRTSAFFFKNTALPLPQIGEQLNVSAILEGSIRISGNRLRITAQLVDVNEDYQFWSEKFDRSMEDIFAVEDEISVLIADKLRENIGHFEIADKLVEAPDVPVAAYKQYLKSRFHILKMSQSDIDLGISILKGLIAAHPQFTEAYLGMHLAYTLIGTMGYLPAGEAFVKGQPYLEQAKALDPDHPECQLHQSWLSFLQDWDLESTYEHLNKVREKRPIVDYYQTMASTLSAEGKTKAAMHYIETAMQLDPFSPISHHLKGFILYIDNRYEEAIQHFEKSIGLKSDYTLSGLYWGQALLSLGKTKEALVFFHNMPKDAPGVLLKLGGTTMAYAASGQTAVAEAGIQKLEAALETEQVERAMNLLILCQTALGHHEKALDLIEKAITMRLPLATYMEVEPFLKPLHALPRFQQLMQKIWGKKTEMGLPQRKYKKALFSAQELAAYKRQLGILMAEQQPYLDPGLTLRSLASMMDLPPNHLSQLLNEGFDKNFAEYVNTFRLQAFKEKANDPRQQHLTLLALALESGFNSKTVFNTFFKKMEGQTPSAWWKAQKQ